MRQLNRIEIQSDSISLKRIPIVQNFDEKKNDGIHFTPDALAEFVVNGIIENYDFSNNKSLRVLDPAIGDGALIMPLIQALKKKNKFVSDVFGFDIKDENINDTLTNLVRSGFQQNYKIEKQDFIEYFLNASDHDNNKFDLIISNPPYVRTQVLGSDYAQKISKAFGFSGRVDIYYAFIEGIARVLAHNGIAGIIVSNKFMRNKSGIELRKRILEKFDILNIWDFGDTKIFKAAVLPCVLILRKKNLEKSAVVYQTKFTTIYSLQNAKSDTMVSIECKTHVEAISKNGNIKVGNDFFQVQSGILKYETLNDVWQLSTTTNDSWHNIVKDRIWNYFGDVAKTKVGIKTTADSVFISDKWDDLEKKPELLRPLTTHKVARQFKSLRNGKAQVLYTHTKENKKRVPVDIDQYPISKKYLLENYESLSSRKYIQEANRKWFEIWVPHDPEVWEQPKVIFRDISKEPTFWLDLDGTVVNGDCYWISLREGFDISTLWLILAIGNSKFIEEYYDHCFNNKMYAGRRRFMTQYVEKFPLPNPELPQSKEIIELSKKIYKATERGDVRLMKEELNKKVYAIFGL